ncbi:MAG: glycosyltransferase [Bacteroidota bacterium]
MANSIYFSIIVPVYNRPEEVKELLESMVHLAYPEDFEIVLVEDGSTVPAKDIVSNFKDTLQIAYYQKPNTGPGDSRNFGMKKAKGNYYILLDSDCILPSTYLAEVHRELRDQFVHCFGGPDTAHSSFTPVQKAIDYAMTSFLTTGGIRGKKRAVGKFQPRSFNMGISKTAFERTGGFGNIHPGEDPDLTFRIWKAGYETRFFSEAKVYHKRRIDWKKFSTQMLKFGMVRPILNLWHPETAKITYWFPSIFSLLLVVAVLFASLGIWIPLVGYLLYFLAIFVEVLWRNKSLVIGGLAIFTVLIQFFSYGYGFLKSTVLVNFSKLDAEVLFPQLFFKRSEYN